MSHAKFMLCAVLFFIGCEFCCAQISDLAELNPYIAIVPNYEKAESFSANLAPVMKEGKWGYINKEGDWVIKPQFSNAYSFSGDLALVYKKGNYVFIDRQGDQVFSKEFLDANSFSDGVAIVDEKGIGEYVIIDKKGEVFLSPEFDYITAFNNGVAAFQKNGVWGYMKKDGESLIPAKYESAKGFSEGLAAVKKSGKWGFINQKGQTVISHTFSKAGIFSQGLCVVANEAGKWGAIDRKGDLIIPYKFDRFTSFREGVAAIQSDGKWGYIKNDGKYLIEPILDAALSFSDGLAAYGVKSDKGLLFGYISLPESAMPKPKGTKREVKPEQESIVNADVEEGAGSLYKPCGEWVNGWEGIVTTIHTIPEGTKEVTINWEIKNKPYGITVYIGKGDYEQEVFKERKVKYTGKKTLDMGTSATFLTVQIRAKKNDTKWRYYIGCD